MPTGKSSKRKRGIRASRAKLAHALTEAGFKTQAALAERIADLEGLDAAPKDVVSRVFRELPVDITTLERVARALGVDAYTLYMSADEPGAAEPETEAVGSAPANHWRFVAALAAVVVAGVYLYASLVSGNRTGDGAKTFDTETRTAAAPLDLGTKTLAVITLSADEDGTLSEAIRAALADDFRVATNTAATLTQNLDPKAAAERLRTDLVIDGEVVTVGRLTGVRVYLFAGGVREQIWAESWPNAALPDERESIAANVALATRRALGASIAEGAIGHYPLAPVQDDYLEGEHHLEQPSNELNVKRAQSRFESALRRDANYAKAHAGLCQTLLEEHWMTDEARALTDAALTCGQALQLDPEDAVVAAAHAHFLRLTGRNKEAMQLYSVTAAAHPKDSAVLSGYANSLLAAFRQSGDHEQLQQAKRYARRAVDVDAVSWKPAFALATMEWLDGNLDGAISAAEEALQRDENENIIANLGTFYVCAGEFESARDTYLRAQALNPNSYVGDEFLGQVYYFLGDYQKSAELRQRAIDGIGAGAPEIHEMWGNLGDSYRQLGASGKAIEAYVRAAEIAERDHLRGTAPVADRAARIYYYTMLASLDPGSVPSAVLGGIDAEIDAVAGEQTSSSAHWRMAQVYRLRGEGEKALGALDAASGSCPGYRKVAGILGG